jgi:DNA repair protein RadC
MKKKFDCNHFAEIELIYSPRIHPNDLITVNSSQTAYDVFFDSWNKNTLEYQEEFKVMYLNQARKVLGVASISKGGMTHTLADVRVILAIALKSACTGMILSHSHPSNQLHPSTTDIKLTHKIVKAAHVMDIQVLDHLIISSIGYYSMADSGIMPNPPNKI